MDDLTKYSALADMVYHRADEDQPIQLANKGTTLVLWRPDNEQGEIASYLDQAGLTTADDNFYYSTRGFGGMIVQDGDKYIVVLRGTDAADVSSQGVMPLALATGISNSNIDAQDIQQKDWKLGWKLGSE